MGSNPTLRCGWRFPKTDRWELVSKRKAPAGFPPAQYRMARLENKTHTGPTDTIIFGFVRPHCASINEYPHMLGEAIFQAGASLTKPQFGRIELMTTAAEDVGGESTLAQRETQNQIARSIVDEDPAGVFRISLNAEADIPAHEIIDSRSSATLGVVADPVIRRVINCVTPVRTRSEPIEGQFAGLVVGSRIGHLGLGRRCRQQQDGSANRHFIFDNVFLRF